MPKIPSKLKKVPCSVNLVKCIINRELYQNNELTGNYNITTDDKYITEIIIPNN